MNSGYIAKCQKGQSDLVYTIVSVLPVCDKPYHMNNGLQQMWADIKYLWNHVLWQTHILICQR